MLKISEMAQLANTTRRTLIFYDEQSIFKPARKTDAGYRYYEFNQLYDLMFILGLKNLGLSLSEIKRIKTNTISSSDTQLLHAETRIEQKISELQRVKKVISQKLTQNIIVDESMLYKPAIQDRLKQTFWCSQKSVTCTEEEIAQLFSDFYKQLDSTTLMDTHTSGFLTDLSVENPTNYADASFRIIKETVEQSKKVFIPLIEKDAGPYASVLVENNIIGINRGLTALKFFCQENNLETQKHLWQINTGDTLIENGVSKYGWLEFAII